METTQRNSNSDADAAGVDGAAGRAGIFVFVEVSYDSYTFKDDKRQKTSVIFSAAAGKTLKMKSLAYYTSREETLCRSRITLCPRLP